MDTAPSVVVRTGNPVNALVFNRFVVTTEGWPEGFHAHHDTGAAWSDVMADAVAAKFVVVMNVAEHGAVLTVKTKAGDAAVMFSREWRTEHEIDAIGVSADAARIAAEAFAKFLPPVQAGADRLSMSFWSMGEMGPFRFVRDLDRLEWGTVRPNYPAHLQSKLDDLTALTAAPSGGRLMVFHGPAGTGKSRFLQTLGTEWADWCDVHYIIDPDAFLHHASYMAQVALGYGGNTDRWKLVVLEDSDEFIDTRAKTRAGHGISRLLNLADGMVGQGLKTMVLVSTNVNAVRFHKAVVRPGRCGAMIEFPAFQPAEAADWCATNGIEAAPFTEPATLAQLYELAGAS